MRTIDLLALQSYAATDDSSPPTKRVRTVAQQIPAISGAGHIIRRPRLTRLLDEADSPLLLLVAPAGYGKTTLAREWISSRGRAGVWFRAAPTCRDPAALALELAHVLDPVRPGVARRVADHLKVVDKPDATILGELLADSDEEWPSNAWFVVDDYHLVMESRDSERLLELVCGATERVLITSRERPSWVDARLLLYGEAFELGQSALAMTHEEAETVLTSAERKPAGLVALANGWPAVIGLAALLPEGITPTADVPGELHASVEVPAELHEYLAQELYNTLDVQTRRSLVLLSLPNAIDLELVSYVAPDAVSLLRGAQKHGFLAASEDRELEIHPLVQSFLLSKFSEEATAIREPVARLLDCLFDRHQWDDAFTVIEQARRREDIRRLIEGGRTDLLNRGRSATLEQWLAWAENEGVEGDEISLARAELSLRAGNWTVAESLAAAAAAAAAAGNSASRSADALLCAGNAAHFADKPHAAQSYFQHALNRDDSPSTRRRALWGRFVSALQLGPAAIDETYARLCEVDDASPVHVLRMQQARLVIAQRRGDASAVSRSGFEVLPLVELVDDPLARTGFLHALSNALRTAAYYEDALDVARREMDEGRRSRLEFVFPQALCAVAAAKCGQGDYLAALADVERSRYGAGVDYYHEVNCALVMARVLMCRGDLEAARIALDVELLPELRMETRGEVYATQSFVAACSGDLETSRTLRARAEPFSDLTETRVLLAASVAAEMLEYHEKRQPALDSLAQETRETGNFDTTLCALRAASPLMMAAAEHDQMRSVLATAVRRTGDVALAASAGLAVPQRQPGRPSPLSARELDVLGLAAQGLTNAAIATRLVISDKTVKTHLQHVYEKLHARSRTEAVVRARELGLLGAQRDELGLERGDLS